MPRDVIRIILLFFLLFFLVSDLMELMSYLPAASSTIAPLIQRLSSIKGLQFTTDKLKARHDGSQKNEGTLNFLNPASRAREPNSRSPMESAGAQAGQVSGIGSLRKRVTTIGNRVQIPFTESELSGELHVKFSKLSVYMVHV